MQSVVEATYTYVAIASRPTEDLTQKGTIPSNPYRKHTYHTTNVKPLPDLEPETAGGPHCQAISVPVRTWHPVLLSVLTRASAPVHTQQYSYMASISIRRGKLAPSTRRKPAGAYGASDTNWRMGVDAPSFSVSTRACEHTVAFVFPNMHPNHFVSPFLFSSSACPICAYTTRHWAYHS